MLYDSDTSREFRLVNLFTKIPNHKEKKAKQNPHLSLKKAPVVKNTSIQQGMC